MFLESVIFDVPHSEIFFKDEAGLGQSLSGKGGTPSTMFVENIFNECGVEFKKHVDHTLDAGLHLYTWIDCDSKYDAYRRRMWTVNCKRGKT